MSVASRPRWCRPWLAHVAAALVVLVMGLGLLRAEARVGATVDEYGHLIRGLAVLGWAPDTRLNWPHPPLPHAIVALPTALRGEKVDLTKLPGWEEADFTKTVKGYWRAATYAEARKQLVAGRRMMIGVAVAVAIWLYAWAQRRMGKVVGLVTLLLWCSHTQLLAHATLVTNDFAAACCALFLAATLVDVLRRPRARTVAAFALASGAAVVTKTSLVAILALCLVLVPAAALLGRGGFAPRPLLGRIGRGVAISAVAGLVAWGAVLAAYRFEGAFLTVAEFNARTEPETTYAKKKGRPIATIDAPAGRILPLPYTYVFAIQFVRAQNEEGHTGWFLGKPNPDGNPAYFTTLARYKTPVGLMVLAGLGVALGLARRRRDLLWPTCLVLAAAYFELAARSKINLGFRHASPTIPWFVLLGARGASELLRLRPRALRAAGAAVVGAAALACAGGAVAAYPLFLGDFNVLAGGRKGGLAVNLAEEDWGQDTPDLARLVKKEKLKPFYYFSRFSTMDQELKHFGAPPKDLDCNQQVTGFVAIGIKDWTERKSCFRWIEGEPRFVVNDHILVFDARAKPEAAR